MRNFLLAKFSLTVGRVLPITFRLTEQTLAADA
jgi:hypothetical protein